MKKLLRKTVRISLISIKVIVGIIGIYLLSAIVFSSIQVDRERANAEMEIFILTNGVQTDIVVPTITEHINWFKDINHLTDTAKFKYLAISWGDKGFYLNTHTSDDLTFGTAFRAAFGLSSTAMHTTFYQSMQEGESCKRILMSKGQF